MKTSMFIIPMDDNHPLILPSYFDYPDYIVPTEYCMPNIEDEQWELYNAKPLDCYDNMISILGFDPPPEIVATFFFFSKLSPHAISHIFFLSGYLPIEILFSFFSSPITEFMGFVNALQCLLNRIALPPEREFLVPIISNLASAMQLNGYFPKNNELGAFYIILLSIYISSDTISGKYISLESFTDIANQVSIYPPIEVEFIQYIHKTFVNYPLTLRFSFADPRFPPSSNQNGILSMKTGVMRMQKKWFFYIKDNTLQYSHVDQVFIPIGGVELSDINVSIPAQTENDPLSMSLTSHLDNPFIFEFVKGSKIMTDRKSFVIFAPNNVALEYWRSSIMNLRFQKSLKQLFTIRDIENCI